MARQAHHDIRYGHWQKEKRKNRSESPQMAWKNISRTNGIEPVLVTDIAFFCNYYLLSGIDDF